MPIIVITGGHHNSALVVAKLLKSKNYDIVWLGHRHSSRGDLSDSAEYLEVTESGIKFYDLVAAKLLFSLTELLRFPVGIYQSLRILRKNRPQAVLSFGGYLGGTVALAAFILGIPIYLHEQTVTAGRANKLIGYLARKIYLTWSESAKYFTQNKTKVVGLPLRPGIVSASKKDFFSRRKPTLLVMGGKLGAHTINQFIFANLNDLLAHFNIIHQTGTSTLTHDYEHALSLKNTLASLSDCYLPVGYIVESEIGDYLHSASYYLGRSGAHITYELAIIGLKSLLVPLMSTHDHEQHKNAEILVGEKIGLIIPSSSLDFRHFLSTFKELQSLNPVPLKLPQDSGDILVKDLLSELKK